MKRNSNITSVGRSSVILMVETQRIHTGEKLAVINVEMTCCRADERKLYTSFSANRTKQNTNNPATANPPENYLTVTASNVMDY